MAFRAHDPDLTATRRAIRAAVALPITIAIVMYPLADTTGAIFAVFGTVGLLINSDFAGTVRRRLLDYLTTGAAGCGAILLGWAASATLVSAVLVTMVVAFTATILGVFRGAVSTGSGAILLLYVLAVAVGGSATDLPDYLLGWAIAVVVSTVTALALLPRTKQPSVRPLMSTAFAAAEQAAKSAWIAPRDDQALRSHIAEFDAAIDAMVASVENQPFRSQAVSDRASMIRILSNQLVATRFLVDQSSADPPPAGQLPFPARTALANAIIACLDGLSRAMNDRSLLVSAAELDHARASLSDGIDTWVMQATASGMSPQEVADQVASHHELRIFALIVEQMVEMARVANGGEVEDLTICPPIPKPSMKRMIQAQLSWTSPWLRNAIRSAAGLGLGVLVMTLTGVDHGFWVLLAVISILRFDAVGTRRFALLAVVGTVVGVGVGVGLIALVQSNPVGLWILLPLLTFGSAWAGSAVNFPTGQAMFTAMVLIALGILDWPPNPGIGLVRIEDIAIGAGVAVVVGMLLWPRGAAAYLRTRLAAAFRTSSTYLDAALGELTRRPDPGEVERLRAAALKELYRTGETFDVASTQRGPVQDVQGWVPALSLALLVEGVARIISELAQRHPAGVAHPELATDVEAARQASHQAWADVADRIDPAVASTGAMPAPPVLVYPTMSPVGSKSDARDLVVAIWAVNWVEHLIDVIPSALPPETMSAPHGTV